MVSRSLAWAMSALCLAGCGGGGGSSAPPVTPPTIPAPTITTLVPASAIAEGSNFVLTVTGTGFTASSVIQWNGSARPTTFVNGTNLQAPIPATDLATAAVRPITVANPTAEGGTSTATSFTVNNPAPTLASVSPSFVAPGGPQFVLTANGTGFVSTSVVRWNGSARTTTFVSATQLTASITAADIASQGSAQVTVFNATPGGGTTDPVAFAAGNPVPQITELVPPVVRPGASTFILAIRGSNYISGATATVNGVAPPASYGSATELQVAVSAADVATPGTAQVVVVNPAPGGGPSNTASLKVAPYGVIDRLSVASDGGITNQSSDNPSISATSRYVAFTSTASNLVAGDTNGAQDIFVRDTCFGVASGCTPSSQIVSVSTAGTLADSASSRPSISADGRYVAFESMATNLVAGDTNAVADVFVRDTCIGASGCTPSTSRLSVATDGSQGNIVSSSASISGDGRFVSFITASILVLGDINAVADVFVRDTCAGMAGCTPSTSRISVLNDTMMDNRGSGSGTSVGSDGRYVAFESFQRCAGCNIQHFYIHVFDTCVGAPAGCAQTAVLATHYSGSTANVYLNDRSLSTDGRFVAYERYESGPTDALIADTCIGAPAGCTASSRQLTPTDSNHLYSLGLTLTPDARFAAYGRSASSTGLSDVVVHDTCIGAPAGCTVKTLEVSESDNGVAADSSSFHPVLSADGSRVVFASDATNLLPGDPNNVATDIFVARTGLAP